MSSKRCSREWRPGGLLSAATAVALVIAIAAAQLNGSSKFVRAVDSPDCPLSAWIDVRHTPHTRVCCSSQSRLPLCAAAGASQFMTTGWAWLLPLLPLALTAVLDERCLAPRYRAAARRAAAWRGTCYIGLMAWRTCVLYLLFGRIQDALNAGAVPDGDGSPAAPADSIGLARRGGPHAGESFDFADHVVLFLVHYIAVGACELAFHLSHHASPAMPGSGDSALGLGGADADGVRLRGAARGVAVSANAAMVGAALLGLWRTARWFHTPLETAVGCLIAVLGGLLPLCSLIDPGGAVPPLIARSISCGA